MAIGLFAQVINCDVLIGQSTWMIGSREPPFMEGVIFVVYSDREAEAHCGWNDGAGGGADEEHAAPRQHSGKGTMLGLHSHQMVLL